MSSLYRLDTDVNEAHAMAQALEDYVRGKELYGSVGGGFFSQTPSLTVGALVMRLRRLEALRAFLLPNQQKQLDDALSMHTTTQETWRVHYTEKASREALSRLDAMRTFFRECADNPRTCPNIYKPEASRRTIVQELIRLHHDLNEALPDGFGDKQRGTDNQLRAILKPADFLWSQDLASVYPRQEFWWLYGAPPAANDDRP